MSFARIYREEVLASRRDRSRRAFFWAKVVSIVLMVTIGAILRAEPELRRALSAAAMNAATGTMQLAAPTQATPLHGPVKITRKPQKTSRPDGAAPLTPDIKVNRFGATKPTGAINLEQSTRPPLRNVLGHP